MHEFSITQSILGIALERAGEAEAGNITKINITIGDLSGIVEESVQFYFDFLSKDTIAAEASLVFEKVPTQLRCRECGKVFPPEDSTWVCPNCKEQKIEIIYGRECYINSIEVD